MTQGAGFVPGLHKIDDYGNGGFRFAGMSHRGSVFASPAGVRALPLTSAEEIDAATLDLAIAEHVDLLIVGTGETLRPLSAALRSRLRAAGVGCETMATGAAVRAYNMLVEESRHLAALLIAV
ncbi:Mth938-like domain-containing protein [Methylocystis bryophila]|uniref:Mth938-like domain-containing protein n=1 Tax=Methylocystis bryophila TaxID=655015 RepID=A0A1W6MU85_9HYPH|nr:Mth938-like domain-containing protein [Methylocystis bryophila]ARN81164.1 hypothetical protein B1812_08805 [Methylocystis bryophila]BDV37099.1 membrane protein [Methylocystis bryophila]